MFFCEIEIYWIIYMELDKKMEEYTWDFFLAKLRRVHGDGAERQIAVEIFLTRTRCRRGLAGNSGGVGVDHADSCTDGYNWRSSRKVTALR